MTIPFNRPYMTGRELEYIAEAHRNGWLAGDGEFTKRCNGWLEERIGACKALLTNSCTAALEMAAILADVQPGDEVIMPSYTFVSTANAFVLRGAVPVFVDIRPDTLNLDESRVEAAITGNTRAIVAVHYAGVGCEMDAIMNIARKHDLLVIEDAAQGILAAYKGRALGGIGHIGCLSFHETKNIVAGEGGAILINDPALVERAEVIREKGTNRSKFFRGQVDKYSWVDVGSSFLPSEVTASFLWAQLEAADEITCRRLRIWSVYHELFAELEAAGRLRRPIVPGECDHNGHMYYALLPDLATRTGLIDALKQQGVQATFHYVPLHTAPAGLRYGVFRQPLPVTDLTSDTVVRLPFWLGMEEMQQAVVDAVAKAL